jgi:hypothetical protein
MPTRSGLTMKTPSITGITAVVVAGYITCSTRCEDDGGESVARSVDADTPDTNAGRSAMESGAETREDFAPSAGTLLVFDIVWPEEHEAATMSAYVLPGKHAPVTAADVSAIAKRERLARYLVTAGDALEGSMSFSNVAPGVVTACAIAKRDRDTVVGFDCASVEITEATENVTVELDPFEG